ncbi:NADP-dependent oxidoreductase [Leucobacter aridicollis]|uniref:Enoyl reductase n=1 Tax=Leucobacter aridicollis TaxID=283878 RepID=A0A852R3Z5_9MICO|nr:NADP-dependent oxidoreductase [Leucobacter aridicollis]NYD25199.1 enoyl reductase [Leucobacter aridicollis]
MSLHARTAIVRHFGPPEVIQLEHLPSRGLAQGEVRVAVRSSGMNPVDARIRSGSFGGTVPLALGTEFAGVIAETRDAGLQVGDAVIGWGVQGANSDLVVTDASRLIPKPTAISWDTAAGIGGVGSTAMTALGALELAAGNTIVVHGAAGGVGTILTQLAHARGLRVIGTASAANHDHVTRLGGLPVSYGPGLADRITGVAGAASVTASIDLAGTPEAGEYAAALLAGGQQAITLVPETAASHGIPLVRTRRDRTVLAELLAALTTGDLVAPTTSIPFTEIVEGHRRLDAGRARGKLVLDLSDNPHLVQ